MSKADNVNNQPAPISRKKSKALYAEFNDEELLRSFKKHCLLNDVEIRNVVERLVSDYMDGSVEVDISDLKKN